MGVKHSSSLVRQLSKVMFDKKHVAFGRILDNWEQITGETLSKQSAPLAVRYRKNKDGAPTAILKVAVPSASATTFAYQKMLMIERINQLIGKPRFTDMLFEHQSPQQFKISDNEQASFKRENKEISPDLKEMIDGIEDKDLQLRLSRYITAAHQ